MVSGMGEVMSDPCSGIDVSGLAESDLINGGYTPRLGTLQLTEFGFQKVMTSTDLAWDVSFIAVMDGDLAEHLSDEIEKQ